MIYVDANATYPVDPAHYDEVARRLKEVDGNPSSIHGSGRAAKVALEAARSSVAAMLGARPVEIVFTSGATEANNFALQGLIGNASTKTSGELPHLIVTAAEHSSVLEPAKLLADRGLCRLSIAPVTKAGDVDVDALLALLTPATAMVAMIYGNNEIGAVSPVAEIIKQIKARAAGAHVHVDAVQMLGKVDLTGLAKSGADSASFSAHKVGGFKGIGALFLKTGTRLALLLAGGGQERGRRPGTENMPGIVSFGLRCDAVRGREAEIARSMEKVRDAWIVALRDVPEAVVHTGAATMLPNTVNFHVEGVPGDDILLNFDLAGIQASSGSACSSGVARPSHVLLAMGYDEWVALNSVRVSFSGKETDADLAKMAQVLSDVVKRVKR